MNWFGSAADYQRDYDAIMAWAHKKPVSMIGLFNPPKEATDAFARARRDPAVWR
jgi:hypothetical protein